MNIKPHLTKTKTGITMALLSLLMLSAFSAINTNIVQAADPPSPQSICGSGQIASAYWSFDDGGFMQAFFAEQLTIDADEPLTNGVYIEIDHSGGTDPSWNARALTSDELVQMTADKIVISVKMDFTRGTTERLHTIDLVWDLTDGSVDPAKITITSHAMGGGGIYKTADVTMCIVNSEAPVTVSAVVAKDKGNTNTLTITVAEPCFDFLANKMRELEETFTINNNAADTYTVGSYNVYVDTKGNDQIRACYIVVV
jgi:hypothetical protein